MVSPTKCRAQGDGVSGGTVGKPCKFKVLVDDDAGPGPLSVSVKGPHPPKPIKISNNDDGSMDVVYHPTAPGDYFVSVLWGGQDIPGSPFTASVTGDAIRNSKKVTAYGDLLKGVRALNLATLTVDPGEGSGPGPIRALAEGPAKPELTLSNAPEGKFLVSFCASVSGKYKLYLKWGDDDSAADISGSPFEIDVTEESSYI